MLFSALALTKISNFYNTPSANTTGISSMVASPISHAREFHGKKLALLTNVSGCTETCTDFDPIKKGRSDDRLTSIFAAAGRPDKKLSVQSPTHIVSTSNGKRRQCLI